MRSDNHHLPRARYLILCMALIFTGFCTQADAIRDSLDYADRTPADRERDERSFPEQVLTFAGLKPGMTALDLFAGAGYYSDIMGRVVGPQGKVYLHNNIAYLNYARKALQARLDRGDLVNVVRHDAEIGELSIPDESVDLVLVIMAYHDLYYKTEDWDLDPISFFGEIHHLLKPNGVLLIVDHAALPDTGKTAAQLLHRIDEAFAQQDIESRGFKFGGSLDVLRNAQDDRTRSVFDPEIRGKTDRFIHKYIKI